jgi:hypothetical protein
MSDPLDKEQQEQLMRCWQGGTMDAMDSTLLIRELSAGVTRFDRKIFWRNFLEYAGGSLALLFGVYGALKGSKPAMALIVGVIFVMTYLWWQHRKLQPLDPSADVRAYRKAMIGRFDDQIRLLSRVKYWYLLPLYIPLLWMNILQWPHHPWVAGFSLAIVTALYAFIAWLNETWAVRLLEEAREKVQKMLEEEQS